MQLFQLIHSGAILTAFALSLVSCGPRGQDIPSAPRIYGGTPVPEGAWPEVVGLAYKNPETGRFHIECTGTLLTPSVVLTAGHCLKYPGFDATALGDRLQEELKVYTGLGAEGGRIAQGHEVRRAVYHPLLRAHPLGYADVGLVLLAQPIHDISPVNLVSRLQTQLSINAKGRVTIVGYGTREDGGRGLKYQVETRLRDANSHEAVTGGEMRDACGGDSGGPVYARVAVNSATANSKTTPAYAWRQVGIVSRGVQVACGQGVYTHLISDSLCWIESMLGDDAPALGEDPTTCKLELPRYTDAELAAVDFAAMCAGLAGNATQRESAAHMHTKLGSPSCAASAARLAELTTLDLDHAMIRDLSPLAGSQQLRELSLRGNRIEDLAPLRHLSELRLLRIDANNVRDLEALADLESKGLLILGKRRQLHNVKDTAFLRACTDPELPEPARRTVQALFWKTMAEDCTTANERLLGMRTLSLADRELTDLSPLAGLQQLESLDLSGNPLGDLGALATLDNLRRLDLRRTGVTDLTPLELLLARGLNLLQAP